MDLAIGVGMYLACSVGAYGFTYAYFRDEFPTLNNTCSDVPIALLMATFGPLGLCIAYVLSGWGKYGWRLL